MADNTFKRYELKYMLDRERYEQVMSEMIRYMQPDRFAHSQIINIYFDTPSHRLTAAHRPWRGPGNRRAAPA